MTRSVRRRAPCPGMIADPPPAGSDRGHVVSAIVGIRAQRAFESGESVLSACHHLSASQAAVTIRPNGPPSHPAAALLISTGQLAVRKLIRGGEFLLALALARLLHADSVRDAASYVCRQAERLAMW